MSCLSQSVVGGTGGPHVPILEHIMLTLPAVGLVCSSEPSRGGPWSESHSQILCDQVAVGLRGASASTRLHGRWLWAAGEPDTCSVVTLPRVRCWPSPPADKPSLTAARAHRSRAPLVRAGGRGGRAGRGAIGREAESGNEPEHRRPVLQTFASPRRWAVPCRATSTLPWLLLLHGAAGDTEGLDFFTNKHFGG